MFLNLLKQRLLSGRVTGEKHTICTFQYTLLNKIVCFLVVNAEKNSFHFQLFSTYRIQCNKTEAYTVRNSNLENLYKYLQHFILFHIFHLLTEKKRRECRAKQNQVQVPLPSKGHVQLQWFELADELYYLRVVLLIHKSS